VQTFSAKALIRKGQGVSKHANPRRRANPPHHLLLGKDTYDGAMALLAELRTNFEAWEAVSRGADCPTRPADRAA
jgi:hypothetical protein